jgi:hypothetical protein
MAIAGAALGPLSVGGVGHYKYRPFLPLQATGALLEDKQAQLYQNLAEQQQGQAVRGLLAPLYAKAAGQELPPGPVPIKALAPMASLMKATTPKVAFDPVQQEKWVTDLKALGLPPDVESKLAAAGYERGRQALGVYMGQAIPLPSETMEQKLKLRTEPTVISIGGRKELADIQHGYKLTEQEQQAQAREDQLAQQAQAKFEQFQAEQKAKGPAALATAQGKEVAGIEAGRVDLDQNIKKTQLLRQLAEQVTTGTLTGNDIAVKFRQAFGDTGIALFGQSLKQVALPMAKKLVGAQMASSDIDLILDMIAGRTAPNAANIANLDNILNNLNMTKRAAEAKVNYFNKMGKIGEWGKEEQIPKSKVIPEGGVGRYIGTMPGGYKIYEDFSTGHRFVKGPRGQWEGTWKGGGPLDLTEE